MRFLNPAAGLPTFDDAGAVIAKEGLSVDAPDPIQPGETRVAPHHGGRLALAKEAARRTHP